MKDDFSNNIARQFGVTKQRRIFQIEGKKINNESYIYSIVNVNVRIKYLFQFSLQDYKQKSTDLLLLLLLLLLKAFPNLHLLFSQLRLTHFPVLGRL